ncbi:c-type cytochrome [Tepidamorphus sp. 3E244]|uniref:c-type cytochrome n=1 Tax=Tepidamorphus sp. 3E244 TaxID=3385498 RepID=UPI0038FCEDA1
MRFRQFAIHVLILAGLGLAGAVAVVGIGLYNVAASSGHWPGVSWVLHMAFTQSVKLRAPPESAVPPLDDPDFVALGARHYDSACKTCHGAPGIPRSATVRRMVPEPPQIADAAGHWEPQHLFWIVKHGAKMTGMPAWPSKERDDHVWPVVAFLEQVGGMDGGAYARLVQPEAPDLSDTGDGEAELTAYCASCHGTDGQGHGNQHVPRLDILSADYLALSLAAYRDGSRHSGMMQHAASGLSGYEIVELAKQFSDVSGPSGGGNEASPDASPAEQPDVLSRLVAEGEAADCTACHGPWPQALPDANPALAGQREAYLANQLELFRDKKRGGADKARQMHDVIGSLDDAEIAAIAKFYAGLGN